MEFILPVSYYPWGSNSCHSRAGGNPVSKVNIPFLTEMILVLSHFRVDTTLSHVS